MPVGGFGSLFSLAGIPSVSYPISNSFRKALSGRDPLLYSLVNP
jgi:hypothetical protein